MRCARFTTIRRTWQALALAALVSLALAPMAQARGLIRDAEIEQTLRLIADPLIRAAGMNPSRLRILIVQDRSLNAFVAGGNNIFLHTGLLQRLDTVEQLQAVLAHEIAHITGGHQTRIADRVRNANTVAGLGLLLSIASVASGAGEAAVAIGAGSQEVARRSLLAHSRAEEASADQAGLRYMIAAGVDPQGLLDVLKLFRGQEILSARRADPYVRTHPLWRQRLSLLEAKIAASPKGNGPDPALAAWHKRMVAKFDAFLDAPARTLRDATSNSELDVMARAIAYHRLPNRAKSSTAINALIKARPGDAFYHELKGQFLLENGDASGAVASYRQAVRLAPNESLILAGLGRALVALNTPKSLSEALVVLERARQRDDANPALMRDLGRAYAANGQPGLAALSTAERFALQARLRDAQIHATRAQGQLPQGSPAWRRAQDILDAAKKVDR
ncbi:MAG: M48 family metalloprotease [Pseudomonadota bacterium]